MKVSFTQESLEKAIIDLRILTHVPCKCDEVVDISRKPGHSTYEESDLDLSPDFTSALRKNLRRLVSSIFLLDARTRPATTFEVALWGTITDFLPDPSPDKIDEVILFIFHSRVITESARLSYEKSVTREISKLEEKRFMMWHDSSASGFATYYSEILGSRKDVSIGKSKPESS